MYNIERETGVLVMSGRQRGLSLDSTNAHIPRPSVLTYSPRGRFFSLSTSGAGRPRSGGGARGAIQTFSRQSRKRLLQLFATVDEDAVAGNCLFVTLTYPAEFTSSPVRWHADLQAFLARLSYRYPRASAIWRLELQERGAPHFHLLIFGYAYIPWTWFVAAWGAIAHENDVNEGARSTKVERIRSWRKGIVYVAKYCAKLAPDVAPGGLGRCWGVHQDRLLPCSRDDIVLTPAEFSRVRRLVDDMIPTHRFTDFRPGLDVGIWTMLPNAVILSILRWLVDDWQSKTSFYARQMGCRCAAGTPACLLTG